MVYEQITAGLDGERTSGAEVRAQNVTAALSISNIIKSSLGPVGLDKMLVDEAGEVTITNDGATILKLLDVEHPAARMLCDLAHIQDEEVGDGTTSVVVVAAELLRRANELVKMKIHPTSIISGYQLACKEACRYIEEHLSMSIHDQDGEKAVLAAAKTSMSSKILSSRSDFYAKFAVDALKAVRSVQADGTVKYPVKAVNILLQHGKSGGESQLITHGYAMNSTVASQGLPKRIENAKIALLDFDLSRSKMRTGVQVLIDDPDQIDNIAKRESDECKERIEKILGAGANVILTTKGIDDLALKYFVEAGAMAVRRCKEEDVRRIARATGGQFLLSLADLDGAESIEAASLGEADLVEQIRVSDSELIVVRGTKKESASSMILRGPNHMALAEMRRSMHDALCVVKRVLESGRVVPGGGAVESALSVYLETFARSLGSREQLAIAEFAEALLSIPKTLAVNASLDATELVATLCAVHHRSQTTDESALSRSGLDLYKGEVVDNIDNGVLEPMISKMKSLQFATEASISILRIDDRIKLNPRPPPKRDGHGPHGMG